MDPVEPTADAGRERRLLALQLGALAEAKVGAALEAQGWTILARNWRGGGGELDLVVEQQGRIRFVEVKARTGADDLVGLEAIDAHKQKRLRGAAKAWLQGYDDLFDEACFLVAWVEAETIEWIDDAFDG